MKKLSAHFLADCFAVLEAEDKLVTSVEVPSDEVYRKVADLHSETYPDTPKSDRLVFWGAEVKVNSDLEPDTIAVASDFGGSLRRVFPLV